ALHTRLTGLGTPCHGHRLVCLGRRPARGSSGAPTYPRSRLPRPHRSSTAHPSAGPLPARTDVRAHTIGGPPRHPRRPATTARRRRTGFPPGPRAQDIHPETPMTEHTSHTSASTTTADPDLFRPAPGAAPMWRMITAQAGMELRIMLRH